MIKHFFCVILLISVSVNLYSADNRTITLNDCNTEISVSDSVEQDNGFRMLLGRYLSCAMTDSDMHGLPCDSLRQMFARPSFEATVIDIISDRNNTINIFTGEIAEASEYWNTNKINLLNSCTDIDVTYKIADKLLAHGIDLGLIALWDNCDLSRLPNYSLYRNTIVLEQNRYKLCFLIGLNYNIHNDSEIASLMDALKQIQPAALIDINYFLSKNSHAYYYQYLSMVAQI